MMKNKLVLVDKKGFYDEVLILFKQTFASDWELAGRWIYREIQKILRKHTKKEK